VVVARTVALAAAILLVIGLIPALISAATARFPNCRALNARYPHGVGRVGAHDRASSGARDHHGYR
jgi:hypothetical protein